MEELENKIGLLQNTDNNNISPSRSESRNRLMGTPTLSSSPTSTASIDNTSLEFDMSPLATCCVCPNGVSVTDSGKKLVGRDRSFDESKRRRVTLNVGGEKHEILWENLDRFPTTRLGKLQMAKDCKLNCKDSLFEICDDYNLEKNEFFFDRNSRTFSEILNLYRKRKIHLHEDYCVMDLFEDFVYWGVDEAYLDNCCRMKFQQKKAKLLERMKSQPCMDDTSELFRQYNVEEFGEGKLGRIRKIIWDLFEHPFHYPAKVMSTLSVSCILISIITFCLATVPAFQIYKCEHKNRTLCTQANMTGEALFELSSPLSHDFTITDNWKIIYVERACIIWFSFEYLLRFFACPEKWRFVKHPLNIIDLFAILPYYMSQLLMFFSTSYSFFQILFLIRVLRILKLARHSTGLRGLGYTFRRCYKDLGVLLLFLFVGLIIFSSLAYFCERRVNKSFSSIPATFWWACITLTTLGYGDMVPVTVFGKIIGGVTSICGCILVALPIALTMDKFGEFYHQERKKEKALRLSKCAYKKG